jgi:hypothetical protein
MIDHERVVDIYIKRIKNSGWETINRTDKGIQIRQIKRMNRLGFWVGLILIPFWGIGFILWLLTLIDYALQREEIRFVTVDQMIQQLKKSQLFYPIKAKEVQ